MSGYSSMSLVSALFWHADGTLGDTLSILAETSRSYGGSGGDEDEEE
jgi:hypothetical protein